MGEIFNDTITGATTIWKDNQSAIAYSQNALVSEKTKHIGLKWHFLKHHVETGQSGGDAYPLTKWWPTCSPNHCEDMHSQDIEVKSWEERNQCNASSRRYL
jgi:hypothetical protein